MKHRLPLILLAVMVLAMTVAAKSWRGITPLQSTKADVTRVLGKPAQSDEYAFYYDLPNEIVVIDFASGGCDRFGFGWKVSAGTVTIIGMIPKSKMSKEAAGVTDAFRKDDHRAEFNYFNNDDEGLQVETHDGFVTNIQYKPTSSDDKSLKCPRVQDCCWDVFPRLFGYQSLARKETMAWYSFFTQRLEHDFGRGIVVVMGKNPAERQKRMQAEQLNVNRYCRFFKFPLHRMLVVDGGYSDKAKTELHMYPIASQINWINIIQDPDPQPPTKK